MTGMDRRTLLSVLAATGVTVAAGGCVAGGTRHAASPTPSGPDPQSRDLADERDLLAAYDATIAAHPDLADRLGPMREDHARHVEALAGLLSASTSPSASATSVPPPEVPAERAGALAALRSAEQNAAAARTDSCVAASGDRAALLGSVAACESSHAAVLV